jgi:hypothetical protein
MLIQKNVLVAATAMTVWGKRGAVEKAIVVGNQRNWGVPSTTNRIVAVPHFTDSINAALKAAESSTVFDLVIAEADIRFENDGVALLNELFERDRKTPQILIGGVNERAFEHVEGWTLDQPSFIVVHQGRDMVERILQALTETFAPTERPSCPISPERRYESVAP